MPYDESWWIKSFLEREKLPTPLQLRRRVEQVPNEVCGLPTEQAVRAFVGQLNAQIVAWLRNPDGPRVAVRPVNADEVVARWRTERAPRDVTATVTEPSTVVAPAPPGLVAALVPPGLTSRRPEQVRTVPNTHIRPRARQRRYGRHRKI
ncbi:hypothetical protein ACLQ25_05360 [Micromonospora sp. DT44]|uniref:hypothetical protein n=1 Tax=Micromonospora sp. DT44 TaxID=3393439 RepID=UPI003CF8A70D